MTEATGITRSKSKESFPPKWLLALGILALMVGLAWSNFRLTSTEALIIAQQEQTKNAPTPAPAEVTVMPAEGSGPGDRHFNLLCIMQEDGTGKWSVLYSDGVVDPDAGPCYLPPQP